MSGWCEANFDGLIGPTHNYAGLAAGNLASAHNKGAVAAPRAAALQGLQKMKFLADLGIPQAVVPPQPRPRFDVLRDLGFAGSDIEVIAVAHKNAPHLLAQCYSASSMWTANAGTFSPSLDTQDGKAHFTPSNLVSGFHRSLEAMQTHKVFAQILADEKYFTVHAPLPAQSEYADEGAANFIRLAPQHGTTGLEVMVYGKDDAANANALPQRFPARQTKAACDALFRRHGVKHHLTLQQNPAAIDAGVFHNDVVSVGNQHVLFAHEHAFLNQADAFAALQKNTGDWLQIIEVKDADVPLSMAVKSYLFNSQLITRPDGQVALIAPTESQEENQVADYLARLTSSAHSPIKEVHYLNVRESMRNGGGPACLRLRLLLSAEQRAALSGRVWLDDSLYKDLCAWVNFYYRESLAPDDLADPELAKENTSAMIALEKIMNLSLL